MEAEEKLQRKREERAAARRLAYENRVAAAREKLERVKETNEAQLGEKVR